MKPLRLAFMGTPGFAATILEALLRWEGCEVAGVFTQPDRPAGRGRKTRPSPVKQLAQARRLPVYQPERLKSQEEQALLAELEPDVAVVAAYGLILPQAVLDTPRLGCVNVHASLLPKYRGAAPIQRAIMNGETTTGITIMQMDAGLDTGEMLAQRALGIGIDDTAASLHDQLADLGGRLLVETLERLARGDVQKVSQDNSRATYAAKLAKEEGLIDFSATARQVHNTIRGVHPWPGAYFHWQQPGGGTMRLGLAPGDIGEERPADAEPGQFLGLCEERLAIACADKVYLLDEVRPENKKPMDAKSFYNGYLTRSESAAQTTAN